MGDAPIRVAVAGARGRVGREVVRAVDAAPDLALVGGLGRTAGATVERAAGEPLTLYDDVQALLRETRPDVLVDFTLPDAAVPIARAALGAGVATVIGTSGLSADDCAALGVLAADAGIGVAVVPNFAVGAVLLIHFARLASRYFGAAEIVELHHDGKADAPSGTALATAEAMTQARGEPFAPDRTTMHTLAAARGGEVGGVRIHSVRLPGLVGHQEVLFGGPGQVLTLRHDATSREAYVPGVLLAIRAIREHRGLVSGLAPLLGLG
ncbi:MAG TPA: 4-hydroxy-tetrahydrodipicolinate reductase [Chloroflexota bacterium]|nr:4-hydroxy-tetrahydrodipicolinate reductase [Chloroflexota bacterium]